MRPGIFYVKRFKTSYATSAELSNNQQCCSASMEVFPASQMVFRIALPRHQRDEFG
jgi:hypothetical protein